ACSYAPDLPSFPTRRSSDLELAQLRQKGEREYIEFGIRKNQKPPFERVGDIQIALTKADAKRHKYSVMIQADDSRLEKKDRTVKIGRHTSELQSRSDLVCRL